MSKSLAGCLPRGWRALEPEKSKSWALKPISNLDFPGYGVTPITEHPYRRGYHTRAQNSEWSSPGYMGGTAVCVPPLMLSRFLEWPSRRDKAEQGTQVTSLQAI